jgi:hypothetical protein
VRVGVVRGRSWRRARAISGQDVVFGALAVAAAASSNSKGIPRPPDWRIVELVQDMLATAKRCAKMFPLFIEMFRSNAATRVPSSSRWR